MKKKDIIIFTIIFIITCIIFVPLLAGHYATDTYNIANVGYHDYAINWSLKDGRLIMAIIGLIADKINASIETYVFITLLIALIISNITVMYLKNVIEKYKAPKNVIQDIILTIISYITIFNFMYLENMYFVESIVMATSILLFIISANILVQKNKKYILKSLILTIIGVICYQGTIGMFFTFVTFFTILKNKKNIKQIVIDLIKCGIIALISVILNILAVKIICNILQLEQKRLGDISNIFKNIKIIVTRIPKVMTETCNLFPKNLLMIFLCILTMIVILYQTKNIKDGKNKNSILYKYLTIIIITLIASSITYILTLTSFYAGRLRNALGALIGIIFLFLYVETELFENIEDIKNLLKQKNISITRYISIVTYMVLILFTIINIVDYESIMLQHKEVNKLEKQEIEELDEYIKEYEEQSGSKISEVVKVPVLNKKSKGYFPNIKNQTSFTHNALKTNWAVEGVINFYTGRNLIAVMATEEERREISDSQKEMIEYECVSNKLYVKIYIF